MKWILEPSEFSEHVIEICLRAVGGFSCLSVISTADIEDDMFAFGPSELSDLGISNPLTLQPQ